MPNKLPRGYEPTEPPEEARLNISEIERIKRLFEDSWLAKYIVMAGVSGVILAVIEIVRVALELYRHYQP